MAFNPTNVEAWIQEDSDSRVLQEVNQVSAVERIATRYAMASDALVIPRAFGVSVSTVNKGADYDQQQYETDTVTLVAKKFGTIMPFNMEDMTDRTLANAVDQAQVRWARSYAITLDNACLGVTGDADDPGRPFISAYRSLTTSDSRTNYTANSNVVVGTSGVSYDDISELLGIMETSNYYDPNKLRVIAHPAARRALRNIKDNEGRPIFVYGQGEDGGTPTRLFGELQVEFSLGCRTSATANDNPTGSHLMYIVNTDFLALGDRSGPESATAPYDSGVGFTSDQTLMKMRSRRAFSLTIPQAAAVLVF